MYVLGLDVGTQGARALVCDAQGKVMAQASEPFAIPDVVELISPGCAEQHPSDWWAASVVCLQKVVADLKWKGIPAEAIAALSVDSTSGTIIPIDADGIALRPAIMYNDTRAVAEADECNTAGQALCDKLGYKFASSFSLPKILWIKKHEPAIFEQTACFTHAADYIVSRLTGTVRFSDTSNALKTGYDLVDRQWPDFISADLGISKDQLPQIVSPGLTIGTVNINGAQETGLKAGTPVVAGVTDGTAGFLASGAVKVGDWSSTIGTTMVLRGVSTNLVKDPEGRVYCHAHPQGHWLPGGASNVGAECLAKLFHGKDLDELNAYVPSYSPTSLTVYPLVRRGERFPFVNPNAEGFIVGQPRDSRDLYAAYLEGVGYVERWCLEIMADLGAEVGDTVFTSGGGSKSLEWMQVRANIMNRRVVRPENPECALGTAAVAASRTLYSDLESAVREMIRPGESAEPEPAKVKIFADHYRIFREDCAAHGYK